MNIQQNHKRGSVLVTTLIITGLVTLVVVALLAVVERQNYFTARSTTWCSEIPIAEAGIEEAMAHLNSLPDAASPFAANGWTLSGKSVDKSRYFTNGSTAFADGYFYTAISTARPPVIVSIGYGRIPLQTNFTQRTVMVLTKAKPSVYGIMAKKTIAMGNATVIDSYNSTNSLYSTGGKYDATKRHDQAMVGVISSLQPAIQQGKIYGYAATGPGGTASGNIGDGSWMTGGSPGVQPGHVSDDFNVAIPDATLPSVAIWLPYVGSPILNGDYKLNGDFSGSMVISKKVRLWITGNVKMTGNDKIQIVAGGSLELYLGNTNGSAVTAEFGGNSVMNTTSTASNFKVNTLTTCTYVRFRGNSELYGVIYAPNAAVDLSGTPDIYGSIVANTLDISGNAGIHYDEALGSSTGPGYTITSWEEL